MRVSPPLTLKALASRIHGQLPLNARESDKLLDLLKTSFRTQLDKVHPTQDARSSPPSSRLRAVPPPQSAFLSATRNIDAMVNNPLLAHRPRSIIAKQPDLTAQFLESIVYGTATLNGAKHYLASVSLAQGKAGPGMIVLDWLRTTALDRSQDFLKDAGLVMLLTKHLTMENKQELLMEELLLESGIEEDNSQSLKQGQAYKHRQYWKHQIVSCIINTSIQRGDHPEVTINHFLKIVAECGKAELQHNTFLMTTAEQIGLITVARRHELAVSVYDNVMRFCHPLIPPRHRASAMLQLYQHFMPDAGPTLWYLRRLEKRPRLAELTVEPNANGARSDQLEREQLISMCLDAAPLFMERKPSDAAWIMDFVRRHFPYALATSEQEVNSTVKTTQYPRDSEEARLRHDICLGAGSLAFG